MNATIKDLRGLFIEQARELFDAVRQEQRELSYLQKQLSHFQLRKLLDREAEINHRGIKVIENALRIHQVSPEGEPSEVCEIMLRETKRLVHRTADSIVRDAVIINSLQRLIHYKITVLRALTSYARENAWEQIAFSIQSILEEQKTLARRLSRLAEGEVNKKAGTNQDSEFSVFRGY